MSMANRASVSQEMIGVLGNQSCALCGVVTDRFTVGQPN